MKKFLLSFSALPMALSLSSPALAMRPVHFSCSSQLALESGTSFQYVLTGMGDLLSDGETVEPYTEHLKLDVISTVAETGRRQLLLRDAKLVSEGAGLGHRFYDVPASVLGLKIDFSVPGFSIAIQHTLDHVQGPYFTYAECQVSGPRPLPIPPRPRPRPIPIPLTEQE